MQIIAYIIAKDTVVHCMAFIGCASEQQAQLDQRTIS